MRNPQFTGDRFDEASMSGDTYIVGLVTSARHQTAPGRFIGKIVRGPIAFAKAVFDTWTEAYLATHLAERYYTMNDAQLAHMGLTRDRLPVELRRVIAGR